MKQKPCNSIWCILIWNIINVTAYDAFIWNRIATIFHLWQLKLQNILKWLYLVTASSRPLHKSINHSNCTITSFKRIYTCAHSEWIQDMDWHLSWDSPTMDLINGTRTLVEATSAVLDIKIHVFYFRSI